MLLDLQGKVSGSGLPRIGFLHLILFGVIFLSNASRSVAWLCRVTFLRSARAPVEKSVSKRATTIVLRQSMPSSAAESLTVPLFRSPVLGDIHRIRWSEDEEEDSFLGNMGVPTFAASLGREHNGDHAIDLVWDDSPATGRTGIKKSRGLEGALDGHGPAFVVDDVLSKEACERIISDCERLGFGSYNSGKNFHGAQQIVVDQFTADLIARRLAPHIDVDEIEALRREMHAARTSQEDDDNDDDNRLYLAGLNRRWRIYKYAASGEESFAPHIDAGFPPSGISENGKSLVWDDSSAYLTVGGNVNEIVSRLTVLIYLNDDFTGGETKFFSPQQGSPHHSSPIAVVKPVSGSALLFPQGVGEDAVEYARSHWPLHEGSPVLPGGRPKYVIRSDVLFATHVEKPPFEDDDEALFRHDSVVRNTFIPKPTVWDSNFLSQVGLLYNPCMGVENLGPFLYSFLRMTKRRRVVEIGAGFTTVWILQALKDNDAELQSIRSLQRNGQCKLLNIDWTIPSVVEAFDSEPSKLFCIDNCEHQRETASGAGAVAKSLGLDQYLEFQKGDAFDMKNLGDSTVDVLWCDFGVGARMKEFISSAWACIRPGGFLLCHSTLTNENTRLWLEAIRNQRPKEITGIEPGEYVEVSLLETHKRFQNSISILQKRRSTDGTSYEEPIYSQYA